MKDLIIIGAGAAGISAAIYAASRGIDLILFEENEVGGLINKVSTITHYAGVMAGESGSEFIDRAKKQLVELGVFAVNEKVEKVDLQGKIKTVTTKNAQYQSKAVIIATGTTHNRLTFGGEEELYGINVFYEARKFANRFKNKEVVLVGGSDGAAKEALYLSKIASRVHLVFVEPKLICVSEFYNKIMNTSNIELYPASSINEVSKKGNEVLAIIKNTNNQICNISSDDLGIFIFAGGKPSSKIYQLQLETDGGFIITNNDMQTNLEGVFAAGDIRCKAVRQVSTAVADGTVAAIMVFNYLKK